MWAECYRTMSQLPSDTHTTIMSQYSDLRPHVMINNKGLARIYSSSSYRCVFLKKVPVASDYCGGFGWKVAKNSHSTETHMLLAVKRKATRWKIFQLNAEKWFQFLNAMDSVIHMLRSLRTSRQRASWGLWSWIYGAIHRHSVLHYSSCQHTGL